MRKLRFDRLLAGTMLALIVAAPGLAAAAPNQTESAAPAGSGPSAKGAPGKMLSASDLQISEKLREIIASKQFDRRIERAADRKAVESFYAARNYAPLWTTDGALNARAKATIARLKNAAADGLDAADYPLPAFGDFSRAEQLAEGDITLTKSVLIFARQLAVGRIAPTRVFEQVDYADHTPDPSDILKKLADAGDVDAVFDAVNPPDRGFNELKDKLAALRANTGAGQSDNRIPEGAVIRPGRKDARVPALRERLSVGGQPNDLVYDRKLYDAIKRVQARADLRPTGTIDAQTLDAINGPRPGLVVDRVIANMERWRWLPRDLGHTYVMVNIPDYTLKVVHDHQVVWQTKIVAGKPQTPTPLLSASMDIVLVNPSWYVPQSIIQNELLPRYASDPQIFDRMGLEVSRGADGNINVVQPPGAANALGRIKFNFPNKYQVYLHDTPEKRLFAADKRAFSHGCMRVENPTKFAEIMLHLGMRGTTPNAQQLNDQFGHDERTYKFTDRPAVYLTYQTVFVDDAGKLQTRDDIYGIDARIRSILHGDERRIADVAPPPDPKRDAAVIKSSREILSRVERREAQDPLVFFEQLFR